MADDIVGEAVRLRWLQGRVPCAVPLHAGYDGAQAWLLTSEVPGRSGDAWLEHDPASLPRVIAGFARFLRQLHALPVDECPFDAGAAVRLAAARARVTAHLVDEDDFDADHEGWSAAEVLAKVEAIAPSARGRVVTHGDFSLGNLMLDAAGRATGCIDVGRLGTADAYQDIAILWNNLDDHGAEAQRSFLREMGIGEVDAARLDFHRCLDELF